MKVNIGLMRFSGKYRSCLPQILYKRYNGMRYAENFVRKGEFIARNLKYFRGSEGESDPRYDPMEGRYRSNFPINTSLYIYEDRSGRYVGLGEAVSISQELSNPERIFVACFSSNPHPLQRKFGKYIVKIVRPDVFVDRFASGLVKIDHMSWGHVYYYNEGNDRRDFKIIEKIFTGMPLWMAKPDRFSSENEFRFALYRGSVDHLWERKLSGSANYKNISEWEKSVTLRFNLGDLSDICDIIVE